jgi:alpha-mannosidase
VSDNALDNGLLRVAVDAKGRLRVADPASGVALDDVLSFEDVGDAGDLYTHSPIGRPLATAWCTGVRTLHRGPLRGEVEARDLIRVPERAAPPDDPLARPTRRARRPVELPIVVRVSLDAGAPFVRLRVDGENLARDHRLRVVLATGVAGADVVADAALGPVERRPVEVTADERAMEAPPPTAPLHRWVALHGAARGAVVYADGLAEYEATPDGRVAVTLVRAVGELSRRDLPERPGNAGWPAPTPAAQCVGPFAAELALALLGPRSPAVEAEIERLADDVLLPLAGETLRAALAVPDPSPAVELEGEGLAFGAVKPSEDGAWVVLRCVNVTGHSVAGAWRVGVPLREARLARLDETPLEQLGIESDGSGGSLVRFDVGPRGVVTIVAH